MTDTAPQNPLEQLLALASALDPVDLASRAVDASRRTTESLITILENLLVQARKGELTGLMYVVRLRGQDHGVGVSGHYLSDVRAGLSAFMLVYSLLGDSLYADQQR